MSSALQRLTAPYVIVLKRQLLWIGATRPIVLSSGVQRDNSGPDNEAGRVCTYYKGWQGTWGKNDHLRLFAVHDLHFLPLGAGTPLPRVSLADAPTRHPLHHLERLQVDIFSLYFDGFILGYTLKDTINDHTYHASSSRM